MHKKLIRTIPLILYIFSFHYFSQSSFANPDSNSGKEKILTSPLPTPHPIKSSSESGTEYEKQTKDSIDKEEETRKQMMVWSRHLGVTCVYCHNQDNFKSDEKSTFKKALKHWQMVRLINEEVFTERDKGGTLKVEADCYMCHRGVSVPKYKEPPQNLMK